ncbi:MAG: hypothetical protein R3E50_14775 [Halioglobus sp.]
MTETIEEDNGDFETSLEEAFIDTLSMPASTALRLVVFTPRWGT